MATFESGLHLNMTERLMVAAHGKDPYVLRQCLSGNAGEFVRGITDYENMIIRLGRNKVS